MNKYATYSCTNCSKEIIRVRNKKLKNHFCSVECRNAHLHRNRDPKGSTLHQQLEDPNFYYLLGWICTDGTISWPNCSKTATSYICNIGVTKKDKQIVIDFQKYFGGKVFLYQNIAVWKIISKEFVDFLRYRVNIDNHKTYNLDVQNWFITLNEEQKYNFIRGCWDGDGYIGQNTKTHYWHAGLASCSTKFLEMVGDFLKKEDTYKNRIYDSKQSSVKTLNIGGTKLKKAFTYMFSYTTKESLSLKRKCNIIRRMINE